MTPSDDARARERTQRGWHPRLDLAGSCRRCRRLRRPRLSVGLCCGASETHLLIQSPRAPAACYGSALNDLPHKLYLVAKCKAKQKLSSATTSRGRRSELFNCVALAPVGQLPAQGSGEVTF